MITVLKKSQEGHRLEVQHAPARVSKGSGGLLQGRKVVWELVNHLRANRMMSVCYATPDVSKFR
eukprot:14365112-Alexandrium_andersonii.AAC.1